MISLTLGLFFKSQLDVSDEDVCVYHPGFPIFHEGYTQQAVKFNFYYYFNF